MSSSTVMVGTDEATARADRLMAEGLIGLAAAAKLLGSWRGGRPAHPSTVTRYTHEGVKLADGRVVKLETLRLGSRLMTSRAAVVRFLAAQQGEQGEQDDTPPMSSTPAARNRAQAAASAELDALGVR